MKHMNSSFFNNFFVHSPHSFSSSSFIPLPPPPYHCHSPLFTRTTTIVVTAATSTTASSPSTTISIFILYTCYHSRRSTICNFHHHLATTTTALHISAHNPLLLPPVTLHLRPFSPQQRRTSPITTTAAAAVTIHLHQQQLNQPPPLLLVIIIIITLTTTTISITTPCTSIHTHLNPLLLHHSTPYSMADQGAMIAPTRKRSRVGENRQQEPPLPTGPLHESELLQFTEGSDQYIRLAALRRHEIYGMRTIDWGLMHEFGVVERLEELFDDDWRKVIDVPSQQYQEFVYEFFSTFRFDKKAELDTKKAVRFTLGGLKISWSIREFAWRSGLYTKSATQQVAFTESVRCISEPDAVGVTLRNLMEFWPTIGEDDYKPGIASTKIRDPVIRYVHRVIGGTILGRFNGTDKVNELDLLILYCMMTHTRVNLAVLLLTYLARDRKKAGKLCGGAYVTMLAEALGAFIPYQREELTSISPTVFISFDDLNQMNLVETVKGSRRFRAPKEKGIILAAEQIGRQTPRARRAKCRGIVVSEEPTTQQAVTLQMIHEEQMRQRGLLELALRERGVRIPPHLQYPVTEFEDPHTS
ncbi:hypothetical protein QVD17_26280 [Tagetes erecta]|uniref:Arabidopsis retrotransposon Orf1 C-terminal domain-containing protein n=1 Tax=Tagetes erecta TaxID=13708 RepID=A0AAD8K6K3_TARER|nr:hypothetical protein QVD17_26280 [Tagetes erecta]